MKILLVLNKPNREILIMESIKREILSICPSAVIEVREMCVPGFNSFVFKFKPNVILTFPFTCEGFSRWYYLFKVFLGAKIISLRAEGVVDFSNEYNVQWAVGFDNYGSTLVDCELFWGGKLAQAVGNQLIKQRKLSSMARVKVVGYPRLEAYFGDKDQCTPTLPLRIKQKLSSYKKEQIVLFITGFHLANYTKQNLFDAKDLNAENMLDELLEGVEISKRYRSEWIENVIVAAKENPEALIVVKKHPIEKRENYEAFSAVNNILFIDEDIQVEEIIPYTSMLFHYGSTALVDAYLSKIPAIYVYSQENKQWYSDLGWPSAMRINVNEIPATVRKCLSGSLLFEMSSDIKRVLKEIFNIEDDGLYRPAKKIAQIILDPTPPQKIRIFDPYFLKSLASIIVSPIYLRVAHRLKRIGIGGVKV